MVVNVLNHSNSKMENVNVLPTQANITKNVLIALSVIVKHANKQIIVLHVQKHL